MLCFSTAAVQRLSRLSRAQQLQPRVNGGIRRCLNAELASQFHDMARKPVEFETIAARNIVRHRCAQARRHGGCIGELGFCKIRREIDTGSLTDGHDFAQQIVEHLAGVVIGVHFTDGAARQRRDAGERGEKNKFLPAVALHRFRQRDVEAGGLSRLDKCSELCIGLAVDAARFQ